MILKQQNGFGDNNIKKQQAMKNLEISIHKEAKELNYSKGSHQNLS
jgi:hypothetical protein